MGKGHLYKMRKERHAEFFDRQIAPMDREEA